MMVFSIKLHLWWRMIFVIKFKHVSKKYDGNTVLDDLNLTIETGDLFVLVGPSGSGKTTTLKMINQLIKPTTGDIVIEGKNVNEYDLKELRLQMGYVLQNIALFPNLSIDENISIQLEALRRPKKERIAIAHDLLEKVGLDPEKYGRRYPHELSGGEQQRIGIIRALASTPKIILMDEPFSALDPISRNQLQELVLRLHKELQTTFVFVTHDMHEALRLGDTIAVMKKGQLQQVGSGESILSHPANSFVDTFFKDEHSENILVKDLLEHNCFSAGDENANYFRIDQNKPLSQLSKALREHSRVLVSGNQQKKQVISIDDLLSYLAQKGDH